MTYCEKLQKWFEEEKKNGLVDIKLSPGELRDALIEDVAREIYEVVTGQRESYSLTNECIAESVPQAF